MSDDNLLAVLQDIKTSVAVLETKLDTFANHEDRIRELEKARWSSSWITALLSATITSVLIAVLISTITRGT